MRDHKKCLIRHCERTPAISDKAQHNGKNEESCNVFSLRKTHFRRPSGTDMRRQWRLFALNIKAWNNFGNVLLPPRSLRRSSLRLSDRCENRPETEYCLSHSGQCFPATEELHRGQQSLRQTTQINPKYALAWDNLGLALRLQNKPDEAIEIFRKVLIFDPKHKRARASLDKLLKEEGESQDSQHAETKSPVVGEQLEMTSVSGL